MKKLYLIILFAFFLVTISCVDDYQDANGPRQLDAPTLRINTVSSTGLIKTEAINAYQKKFLATVLFGSPVEFNVSIIDAPGKIGAITVESSIAEFATVALDESSVTAIQGMEKGSFKFTLTPNEDLENSDDYAFEIIIKVSDKQLGDKGEEKPKITTLTVATVIGSPCLSEGITPGNYQVTNASFNLDDDTELNSIDSLEKYNEGPVIIKISKDRPGMYTIDEVTGGVWPVFYGGRANPKLQIDLCSSTITGHSGSVTAGAGTSAARTFTLNGTLNSDGTINITWSYVRDDDATPDNPSMGSYTLTPI